MQNHAFKPQDCSADNNPPDGKMDPGSGGDKTKTQS